MKTRFLTWRPSVRAGFLAVGAVLALTSVSLTLHAQQKLSKRYPAGKNVRIELKNISGTIVVESWDKEEIRLSATMESKGAHVVPRQLDESLVVDVMSDNRGRSDVGDILTRANNAILADTADEHFVIDHHPDFRQVVLASPCSGHGFKFASVIGEILADLATGDGTTRHDIDLLRLDRLVR